MPIIKSTHKQTLFALTIILFSTLCAGCAKKTDVRPPTIINAKVVASSQVNPDDNARPSPVILRIYELKSLGAFEATDFFTLFEDDSAQLGKDLTHREEYQLRPGDQKNYSRKPSPETQYLAVMAAYRKLNQAVWKASIPIPPNKTTRLTILLDPLAVSIKSE